MREAPVSLCASDGLSARTFASAQDFLAHHRPDVPSCLVLDVHLPGLSGLDLQQELLALRSGNATPLLLQTKVDGVGARAPAGNRFRKSTLL